MSLLRIENLRVSYASIAALQGVSLEVTEGEIVTVIGPNGAGKSTLLAAIAGIARPKTGDIIFDGKSLLKRPPEGIVRLGISLVPENRRIFDLTVEENLRVGTSTRRDRRGVQEDLERVFVRFPFLKLHLKARASVLSGGEQQQLAIARALLARPRLLMLDEPSLGLSPILVQRVFELILELRAEGRTVLLVEQMVSHALRIADRFYALRKGTVDSAGDGRTGEQLIGTQTLGLEHPRM